MKQTLLSSRQEITPVRGSSRYKKPATRMTGTRAVFVPRILHGAATRSQKSDQRQDRKSEEEYVPEGLA